MGKCNIDHTHADVITKLQSQKEFIPKLLVAEIETFLNQTQSQEELNELFHLLKKYDLATENEREIRNQKLSLRCQAPKLF